MIPRMRKERWLERIARPVSEEVKTQRKVTTQNPKQLAELIEGFEKIVIVGSNLNISALRK